MAGVGDRRLRRCDRLRDSRDYVRLTREGGRRAGRYLVVLVGGQPEQAGARAGRRRLGVTASRKVGGAVVRNRFKRRVREVFRLQRELLPDGSDVVVIARPGAGQLSWPTLEREVRELFRGGVPS